MYRRRKEKQKRLIITFISIVVVFVVLFLSLTLNRNFTPVESGLKNFAMVINKIVMYPFTALNSDKGKDLSKSYTIQKNVNGALESEIKELKEALELKSTLTEYSAVTTTVLSRNKSYWFNTITIDKGLKDGIKKEMLVVTKRGLVGKISKVSRNSSEVKLITSDDVNYKVSVSINTASGDTYAILDGYDNKSGYLKVTGVDKTHVVNVGDKVVTSGLGGKEPRGIYIGVVKKVESDKYNLSNNLYLETGQDFDKIHYLTVLRSNKK